MKTTLTIEGMHCGACAMNLDDALEDLDGVRRSKTSYARASTKIEYDETQVTLEALQGIVSDLGYKARPD